ncbi:MAG TPA: response regulator, partial [Candidatus Deferrimicrobium sp.]
MSERIHRILCVDDEVMNLKLLEAILLPSGYEVVTAGDGQEALRKIREGKIDCVLLDVMMPKMNGFDACRKIRENEETRHLPVVLITALTSREDRIRGIEAGADDFLSKPFDDGEVIARTKMLLRMKSLGDQLRNAYSDMIEMNSYSEKIIRAFNDADFDLMSKIDGIVEVLFQGCDNGSGGPQSIVVRLLGGTTRHEWFLYKGKGDVRRAAVAMDFAPDVPGERPST